MRESIKDIVFKDPDSYKGQLKAVLSNENIFALDLVKANLSDKIESMFKEMLLTEGAVRKTLHKYVNPPEA